MSLVEKIFFTETRVGIDGTTFTIYKFRTMVRGQEDERMKLLKGKGEDRFGHIRDDPRITKLGEYMRRYWIDEIPQMYNLLKGDMKLVGARALSPEAFELLPEDLKKLRRKYKSSVIPCWYTDYFDIKSGKINRSESERRYFKRKKPNPLRTDVKYFLKFCDNVLRGARGV